MRRGELLALRWGDLDLGVGTVRVKRALSLTRDGLVFVPPKTTRSSRSIALTALAIDAMRHYRDNRTGAADDALVFPNPEGGPMRPSTMSQHFERLASRVGLPKATRLHDLRHTTATLMFLNGTHPKVVQEVLGHSTISITLDLYTHFVPSLQRGAIKAIDELLGTP
jgi:integrase